MDLLLVLGASYGCAWLLTKSLLMRRPRGWVEERSAFFGRLLGCIICTGTWTTMGLALLTPWISFVSPWIHPKGPFDVLFLGALWIAVSWPIALRLGDAD